MRPLDDPQLTALVNTIVPGDDFPSASAAGSLVFLRRLLEQERPEWTERLAGVLSRLATACPKGRPFLELNEPERLQVLDSLSQDGEYRWFAALVHAGYYADPANGGNEGAVSWRMLGWDPVPAGGWPSVEVPAPDRRAVVRPDELAERYDAVVVGAGAGGGVAAATLTEAGWTVLLVEAGDFPETPVLATDHLRNPRTHSGLQHRTLGSSAGPRTLLLGGQTTLLSVSDPQWGSNANTVGGGTRVYGAQAWRYMPQDFAMASTYGVPEGSAVVDWPIGYDDLEPYYTRAEYELGVCGSTVGDSAAARRSRPYPMPALPLTATGRLLARGAQQLGLSTAPVPLAINSVPYDGRPACARCGQCVGFSCPVEAKNGTHNTLLPRATQTHRLALLPATRVERIVTDRRGRVTGVRLVGEAGGGLWRSEVTAGHVVVCAGATETARLLLHSTSDREPSGLGNNVDQVGRHLQGHLYSGALGIFAEPVNDFVGPGPSIATNDFRHGNPGLVGGGMLADDFVPTPLNYLISLREAGLLGLHGRAVKERMRHLVPRTQRVVGPIQELTSAESRVRLDPYVRDRYGIPVVQLSGSPHREDRRTQRFLSERAADWLTASGADEVVLPGARCEERGPSSGQHQAGTARMGTDPARSVTDPYGRVWGHDNLYVADASLHVTNGGVNPVLTVFANALRVMDALTASRAGPG